MTKTGFCKIGALAAVMLALPAAMQAGTAREAPAASEPTPRTEPLGTAGAWTAYASHDKTGRVCYLVGQPQKSEPAGAQRKAPTAMVTHRPAENITNVVSFVEGYPLKEGSDVALDIGGKKFDLFTKDDSAWARTADLDRAIVATLAKGKAAVVKGEPQRGRGTIDVYSLAGFPKALALIDKACGVKREEVRPVKASAKPRAHKRTKQPVPHH